MGKKSGHYRYFGRYAGRGSGSGHLSGQGRFEKGTQAEPETLSMAPSTKLSTRQMVSRWSCLSLMACLGAVASVVAQAMPALAGELTDWGYDVQTRSLNVVLPDSVAPSVSVVAPNQLLLELPDTQIGEVGGQRVGDGLVESIVLEQATPETVWMVVEFAPGTVLADAQTLTQMDAAGDNMQQWQISPALLASRRTADVTASAETSESADLIPDVTSSDAGSLRTPSVNIAQSPEFPELPVLEPALSISEPVSVPPIDASPLPVLEQPVAVPTENDDWSDDGFAAEAEGPVDIPVVSEFDPVEAELSEAEPSVADGGWLDELAADELAADDSIPDEPPFLGEVAGDESVNEAADEPIVAVPDSALPDLSDDDGSRALPESLSGRIADLPPVDAPVFEAGPPELVAPPKVAAPTSAAVEPVPVVEIPAQSVTPANTQRWPDPVPFGQPLP